MNTAAKLILLALVGLMVSACPKINIPSTADARRANEVMAVLRAEVVFPVKSGQRQGEVTDTLYAKPGADTTTLTLYGYTTPKQQDDILDKVTSVLKKHGITQVTLKLYERELVQDRALRTVSF